MYMISAYKSTTLEVALLLIDAPNLARYLAEAMSATCKILLQRWHLGINLSKPSRNQ